MPFLAISYAQEPAIVENAEQHRAVVDSLTMEEKEVAFHLVEEAALSAIDSIMDEGRYMQALDMLDYLQEDWKKLTNRAPSLRMYLKKANIQMYLEEWTELIATTEECLDVHKDDILEVEGVAALMYSMQGNGHRNLEKYRDAIRSYENAAYYYTKRGDLGGQGDMFCNMAYCYSHLNKYTMASSFYEKGLDKYLKYFDTTRFVLLRDDFYVKDPYKQTVLGVFAAHLFCMAVYEQDYGSRSASKDYLLMSAHCGDENARSEYRRIYGH